VADHSFLEEKVMSDDTPEKDRRLVAVVSIIADRDEKIEQLQRERDELKAALSVSNTAHHEIKMAAVAEWKAEVERLTGELALSDSAIAAIRELLKHHNVPTAAFIDDHVGNAIAQRDAAEASLSKARKALKSAQTALRHTVPVFPDVEREIAAALGREGEAG
jgi:chromosome segregation ATPase